MDSQPKPALDIRIAFLSAHSLVKCVTPLRHRLRGGGDLDAAGVYNGPEGAGLVESNVQAIGRRAVIR